MTTADTRPFYSEFAWAYDLIIPAPVQVRCKFWSEVAGQRGLARGSRVVDAGCGTGAYTLELARMGYEMTGIDVSPDLIAVAETKARKARLPIKFSVTDIRAFSGVQRYDGILCRGVLNDFVTDAERRAVCRSLGNALRCGGLLVLDVREWYRTALIKREQPLFERTLETEKGRLTFRSRTALDVAKKRLIVSERHILIHGEIEIIRDHSFNMRCWTRDELRMQLEKAGFSSINIYGDYDVNTPAGLTDRLVAVASRAI